MGQYNASQRSDDRVSHVRMVSAFRSFANLTSHTPQSQMRPAKLIVCLKVVGRKSKLRDSFALFASISQVSTCHLPTRALCVREALAWASSEQWLGDAKQAMSNGAVESGLI